MQLWEIESALRSSVEGLREKPIVSLILENVSRVTINELPLEILFNILEKVQDNKRLLFNCLTVCKQWREVALHHLWYHFEFGLAPGHRSHLEILKRIIDPESLSAGEIPGENSQNFERVRSLALFIHLGGDRISTKTHSAEVEQALALFTSFLKKCQKLRSLRITVSPFVESDVDRSLREGLSAKNELMMELIKAVAEREYSELFFEFPLHAVHFEPSQVETYRQYIQHLGPQVTRLHLCDDAATVWPTLAGLKNLRRLDFRHTGNSGEDNLAKFWDTIGRFRLEELALAYITFPRNRKFKNWDSLRSIRLNQFNDVEGTCPILLRSFPNLRSLALHNPPNNFSTVDPSYPIGKIVCTNLRKVVFTRCRPQKNILSQIAKACPHLDVCMPPDNASDEDVITLIDSCKFLTTLLIDGCRDLTSTSIHYISRAKRLRSLLYNFEHLVSLDEECIITLAKKCPDLHSRGCRVATVGEKNEKYQRILVRDRLSGSARFKRWLLRFIIWTPEGPFLSRFSFDIERIREEISSM
jgi:F-box-like